MEQLDKTYEQKRLIAAVKKLGFPEELGYVLADQLGGPWSMHRMTGYLLSARPNSVEDIADELFAILEHRHAIVDKKITETANAKWNDWLNSPEQD